MIPPKPRIERFTDWGVPLWRCYTPFPRGDWRICVDLPGFGGSPAEAYAKWGDGRNAECMAHLSRAGRAEGPRDLVRIDGAQGFEIIGR